MPLSSVKESPLDNDDASRASGESHHSLGGASTASLGAGKGLKRSPYLSQMTAGVDSDLMALLSRPSRGEGGAARGGGAGAGAASNRGGLDFFQLKRPGVAGSNLQGGARSTAGNSGLRGGMSMGHLASQAAPAQRLSQPHLRSALRSGHQLRTMEHSSDAAYHDEHRNVTFSQNTKQGSQLGLVDAATGAAPAASRSMANASVAEEPQPNENENADSIAYDDTAPPECAEGSKPQFPFYFSTLREPHLVSPSPQPPDPSSLPTSKAKSTSTLKYYYKAGMRGGASAGLLSSDIGSPAFSKSLRNLTFREMLDEGDGKEGDLNLRLRNEQWKVFRSSSCGTADSVDEHEVPVLAEGPPGNERSPTPGSSDEVAADAPAVTMHDHARSNARPHQLVGSHRGCVSAHDLAVLRRSASRIKVDAATPSQGEADSGRARRSIRPGATLGGSMLSRISSGAESGELSLGGSRGPSNAMPSNNSPLAQMMAELSLGGSRGPSNAMPSNNSPLAQMMAEKFGVAAMPDGGARRQPAGMSSLMGRRVHTVSAGLAYGSAGFAFDPKTRLSKFDLRKADSSALSIASGGGNGGGGFGKNEEWR